MRLSVLIQELRDSLHYKQFISKHPDAYFATALLILDLKSNSHQIQLDFFLPQENKLASFEFPTWVLKVHDDQICNLTKQSSTLKIDINELEPMVKKILKDHTSPLAVQKIIAVIKENVWNLTCMDDMLGIVRMKINANTGEEVSFSKGSISEVAQVNGGELGKKFDEAKKKASSQSN